MDQVKGCCEATQTPLHNDPTSTYPSYSEDRSCSSGHRHAWDSLSITNDSGHSSLRYSDSDDEGRDQMPNQRIPPATLNCRATNGYQCPRNISCCIDTATESNPHTSPNPELTDSGTNGIVFGKPDIDTALFSIEHISVRVQGMDCTGCEKKLRKSLTSLAELSDIKTSLLLAQAEFDLVPSLSIDGNNIAHIIERMTGYTCTKLSGPGAQLELIMENTHRLTNDWPKGVTALSILSQNHVLITYSPRVIGARELMSNPIFREAKLAPPAAPSFIASGRSHLQKTCYMTLLSAMLTIPVLVLTWARLPKHEVLYGAVCLGLATIVQTVIAGPFYSRALNAIIFSRMIDMDLLIVLSSSAAYIYSVVAYAYLAAGKPLSTGEFFETSTLLVTLIMVGRTATAFARQRSIESVTIESLQVPSAIIVDLQSGEETVIDARLLQYQDFFKVPLDKSVVTDGVVISGKSEVDESMVTGEAILVPKKPGNTVVAGSVNHLDTLIVRVTRLPCENTIKTIGSMVDAAKSTKARVQELADRAASYFVPAIIGITLTVFVVWVAVGKGVRHQSAAVSSINAMTFAITVLIVSCPCAIGLAVPMVVLIAAGVAARQGLIFKTAETIDLSRNITHVVFDKTGTLTQDKLDIVTEEYPHKSDHMLRPIILDLTTNSTHPVSKAITAHLNSFLVRRAGLCNVTSVPGSGMEASWNGSPVKAGNPYWLGVQDSPEIHKLLHLGLTIFCVTLDCKLVAIFGLQALLRQDALETITELNKRSIEISILSGDNEAAVRNVAIQLGIPAANTRARCSPEQKQTYVRWLLEPTNTHDHAHCDGTHPHPHPPRLVSSRRPVVLFVGDGTNDAPSLAQASIGLHINASGSSAIASSAADATLLRPALVNILTLIDLSRAFHRRVLFNFIWSAVYNVIAVLLAAGAIPKARIPTAYAGLGELVSVLPVLGAAAGLRFWRR